VIFRSPERIIELTGLMLKQLVISQLEPLEEMSRATLEDRFLALLEEHRKILFKVANLYCRNSADLADVVQEMVLQAWRSFGQYDESRRFSTWLYRVALNVAISFYRGETRRSRTMVPADESILEIAAGVSESSEVEDHLRLLRVLIEQLNALDRAIVLLYLEGNPYDIIADVLGISESNVGTRINRIKQRLHRGWGDHLRKEHTHAVR
jgi:RNA polymerase sigma factor (sigma-70 family)